MWKKSFWWFSRFFEIFSFFRFSSPNFDQWLHKWTLKQHVVTPEILFGCPRNVFKPKESAKKVLKFLFFSRCQVKMSRDTWNVLRRWHIRNAIKNAMFGFLKNENTEITKISAPSLFDKWSGLIEPYLTWWSHQIYKEKPWNKNEKNAVMSNKKLDAVWVFEDKRCYFLEKYLPLYGKLHKNLLFQGKMFCCFLTMFFTGY